MAVKRRPFESERSYRRRKEEERRRKRGQRKRKKRPDPIKELLNLPRRQLKRKLRQLKGSARRKLRRQARSRNYRMKKRVFGLCPVCNRPNDPWHTCRQRFTERNADQMSRRFGKLGGLPAARQNPNLWTRQQP